MTKEQYILWVAPRIVLDSLQRNLLPSPRIAQACFEPNYGTSELAVKANNLFGAKANDQWEGKCYSKDSGECYDGKNYVGKISDFQAYDSWEESIFWQGWMLENRCTTPKYHPERKHYAELIGNRDYKDCARILDEKNYGTSPEYAKRVIDYVELHDLTMYDSMTEEEAKRMIKEESEENKMVINIHAGHNPDGMIACGAVGLIKESTEARAVKDLVIAKLQSLGHTVYDCTVNNGTGQSDVLKKIVEKCNAHDVNLDISIHFNAGAGDRLGNNETTGTEVFIHNTESEAKPYAQRVAKEIAALGFRLRDDSVKDDVKNGSYLYVLKHTKAPAMLVECCFVDDIDDVQLYSAEDMANAIVKGITGSTVQEEPCIQEDASSEKKLLYRVQVGAYSVKKNAEAQAQRLKAAGFDCFITTA